MKTAKEIRIYAGQSMEAPEVIRFPAAGASIFTKPSPTPGRLNEDSAALIPLGGDRCVLVVADGMGGCPGGDLASQIAVESLSAEIREGERQGVELRESILAGFDRGNQGIVETSAGSGATVIVAEIDGTRIRTYHCGDSRAIVTGGLGKIKLETVDHSPVGYAVESGVLSPEEAMHHHARHLVSNFMGTHEMKIEMSPVIELKPRDTLVLASDGLFDNLHGAEVAQLVRRGTLEAATRDVIDTALRRMVLGVGAEIPSKPDDFTMIVYRPRRIR